MLNNIRKFIQFIIKVNNFLSSPFFKNYNGSLVIFVGILGVVLLAEWIGNRSFIDITISIFIWYFFMILPFAIIGRGDMKRYILLGEKVSYINIIKSFSLKSYILFLGIFTYSLMATLFGYSLLFESFGVHLMRLLMKESYLVFNTIVLISSITYFIIHIAFESVNLQEIRVKLSFLTAVGTTLATVFGYRLSENVLLLISMILASYYWVQYIIELKVKENIITNL